MLRRLDRRLRVTHAPDLPAYLSYVQGHPAEAPALMKDLLISVTRFCRDPEAFEALRETVVGGLVEGRPDSEAIRMWVPGCATARRSATGREPGKPRTDRAPRLAERPLPPAVPPSAALPATRPPGGQTVSAQHPPARERPDRRTRVLLVEDDFTLRESLRLVLETELEVETAADGDAALERLTRGDPPDVVILDVLLPGLSGEEILDELKRRGIRLPVILISAHADLGRLSEREDVDRVLAKPFVVRRLIREVRGLRAHSSARPAGGDGGGAEP